jgi:hypothetical protein
MVLLSWCQPGKIKKMIDQITEQQLINILNKYEENNMPYPSVSCMVTIGKDFMSDSYILTIKPFKSESHFFMNLGNIIGERLLNYIRNVNKKWKDNEQI